jgi:hypothetical protein
MAMVGIQNKPVNYELAEYIERLESGGALLPDTPENLLEVVGILKSYGVVLDAYSKNLIYMAEHQFLVFFPFFKYFNGDFSFKKLLRHWLITRRKCCFEPIDYSIINPSLKRRFIARRISGCECCRGKSKYGKTLGVSRIASTTCGVKPVG